MKILHITESFGGGVANAIRAYAEALPEVDHHLLKSERKGSSFSQATDSLIFASVGDFPGVHPSSVARIRQAIRRIEPDVVHVHSSFAAALTRIAILSRMKRRIVYTPHCYSFERLDLPALHRVLFMLVEAVLSRNTAVVAGCSPRELVLARRLRAEQRTVYVPGIARPTSGRADQPMPAHLQPSSDDRPVVITAGRVSRQKDPAFFIDVVTHMRRAREVDARWIGGGDPDLEARLESHDIRVTGWLSAEDTHAALSRADVYIHCASWEGMPLTMLEAHAAGTPVIYRRVPSLSWLDETHGRADSESVARKGLVLLKEGEARIRNVEEWAITFGNNTAHHQRLGLREAYGIA